jgi:hypothetical protein
MARATDPDGREVVLDASTRLHLVEGRRGWLLEHVDLILVTVSLPDHREDDPAPWPRALLPPEPARPRALAEGGRRLQRRAGWIMTVLVQDKDPRGTQR